MVNGHKIEPAEVIHIGHPDHARRLADHLGKPFDSHFDVCISRTWRGRLVGGALYQHYTGPSISMHVAGFNRHWLSRNALFAAFHYPFEQLKVGQIMGVVPETNVQALAFDLGLGFREVARVPGALRGGAAVVLCMRRENCRWLHWHPKRLSVIHHMEPTNGRRHQGTATA